MFCVSDILTGFVALLEIWFLIVEMFLWTTPRVARGFGFTREFAEQSFILAKNQGLYNGFLAAGLIWGLLSPEPQFAFQIKLFFLACVLIAGVYGAMTANRRILFIQALPALIAVVALVLAHEFEPQMV
jgi:putative membrane protein